MSIREMKLKAKADMKNNYGFAILTSILLTLTLIGSIFAGLLGPILVGGAVTASYAAFYLDVANHDIKGIDSTYRGFKKFGTALLANVLICLIEYGITLVAAIFAVIFQSTIGGSNAAVAAVLITIIYLAACVALFFFNIKFFFTFFVMNGNPELSAVEVLKKSWNLTKGHFWKIVLFELTYIGWWILCCLTLGALFIYVTPYYQTAKANFYIDLGKPVVVTGVSEEPAKKDRRAE